jgi:hypothetical protein
MSSVEYLASALGVIGAAWLALGLPHPLIAWVVWLVSNILFIAWAWKCRARGILTMNAVYLTTSIIGVARCIR